MLDLGKRDGFITKDVDHYAGHLEIGQGEKLLGILSQRTTSYLVLMKKIIDRVLLTISKKETTPDFGIVPDGVSPTIYAEK